jgi:hypothetical protein
MIIYTCITNNYCQLPEIEDLGHQYICFHDGTVEPKSPWELRSINYQHEDPVVLSRHPKILFHEYFDEPCVYVDASRLKHINNENFFKISNDILASEELILMEHPEQHNYLEECFEYYARSWVDSNKIIDLTKYLSDQNYDFENHDTIFACILWRVPNKQTIEWSKLWWSLYEKCNPRDQLSGSSALKISGIDYSTEHPYVLLSKFTFYKDFWYDLLGKTGEYSDGKRQLDLKEFMQTLSDLSGIDYKTNINLDSLVYLRANGAIDLWDELKEDNVTGKEKTGKGYQLSLKSFFDQRGGYDFTVYTCITNNYDNIPDENYYDPKVRYVCFHDGTIDTTKGPWEYIDVRDYCDLTCPRRLSAFPKINPHKLFEVGTHCVWIDACYIQTKEFIDQSRQMFPNVVTTMEHCYDFSYYDEMLEGFLCSFFSYDQGIELTKKLFEAGYNFKEYCSPCCTIIWRTIWDYHIPEFSEFCDLWWEWSLVGSNRDQISFDAARQFSGIKINKVYNKPPSTLVAGINLKFDLKNKNRKGKHPKRGNLDQWKRRDEFVEEMRTYAKLSPKIYAKHEHITMMDWNGVFDAPGKRTEYTLYSKTIKNYQRQCKLWDPNNPIRDRQVSFNDYIWNRDEFEGGEMQRNVDRVIEKYRQIKSRQE